MDIKKEITQIILANDFIIVPGFGAFLHEFPKPSFDNEGNLLTFQKQIRFENLIKMDFEGKLFDKLHQMTFIPINLIATELEDFVIKVNNDLKENKRYNWEGVGSFFINDYNELTFFQEKNTDIIQNTASNFISKTLNNEDNTINESKVNQIKEVENVEEEELNVRKKENTYILSSFLYLTPLLFLVGGLAYVIFIKPTQNSKIVIEQRNLDSIPTFESNRNIDSNAFSRPNEFEKTAEKNQNLSSKSEDDIEVEDGTIISIGVYRNRINVDSLAQTLAENGVPVKVRAYKGKFKLFVVSYNNEQTQIFVSKIVEVTGERPIIGN